MPGATSEGPSVAVIGGGPGGLMAAEVLATAGARVTVFEFRRSMGRKFLLAGRGGLNLTHSEPVDALLDRYGAARAVLEPAIAAFGPDHLRRWCADLGQETFVGTSGRVFPAAVRATPLLRAWLDRLDSLGVERRMGHRWTGWVDDDPSGGRLTFVAADGSPMEARADATVLALGGASWPHVGSDGGWADLLRNQSVVIAPLQPANCGFVVRWAPTFAERFAGVPLKNVTVSAAGRSVRGDAMVTATGIEGGPVYGVSAGLRDVLASAGFSRSGVVASSGAAPTLVVDLLPDLTTATVEDRLRHRRAKDSATSGLRKALSLPAVAVVLAREATGNRLPADPATLATLLKAVPIAVVAPQPLEHAISTAGGVALEEIDATFMLRRIPGTFVAGEMLDWEAPTGGYLLQATYSTAVAAAAGAWNWLQHTYDV